jgi:hypothetical protein
LALAIPFLMPLLGDRMFSAIEKAFTSLARRKTAAIVAVFVGTIAMRLALLPLLPVPAPAIHDEFAYLVQSDIFAHGHLALPPHPMAPYFETFYINFQPTYSSMYPPAQAAALAIGRLLGHPWIGVLLSSGAMAAAILWMLQGWLPAQWALLGTIIITLRIGIFGYWVNSYWGGAVAAAGAALVMGALPRILKHQRPRDAWLLGIGTVVLANSRPLEGFLFCLPVVVVMGVWLYKQWRKGEKIPVRSVVLPIAAMQVLLVCFTLYYNWRVTGDPLEIPHALFIKQYMSVLLFIWQKPLPPKQFANPQFHELFDRWVFEQYNGTLAAAKHITWQKIVDFWHYFLGVFLTVPLLAFPWVVKDRRTRLLLIQFVVSALGILAVTWFLPHYAAPLLVTFLAIWVECMRHMRQWKFLGRPVGIGLSRVVVVFALVTLVACAHQMIYEPYEKQTYDKWQPHNPEREQIIRQLKKIPGEHLVLVHYTEEHNIHMEWVYNSADIDNSKIVWAREIPGMDLAPLFAYYPKRKVWEVEADDGPPELVPYSGPTEVPSN